MAPERLEPPRTVLARRAEEAADRRLPPVLLHHSRRTFRVGLALGVVIGTEVDEELLSPPPCFTTPASIHYRNSGAPGAHHPYRWRVSREAEDLNRRLLRARDAMDRAYAQPLDVRVVAAVAHISPAHFSRCFRSVFGETPHRYLQRRRIERSMFLLRQTDRTVTNICFDVGFTSLGTFSRTFRWIVGETPSGYRTGHGPVVAPHCVQLAAMRPRSRARPPAPSSSFGEASLVAAP